MLTLYGRANSSNVRKVLWLIGELNLEVNRLDYGRGFKSTQTPEYLALNPNGLVPTLVDGDFVLWESHAIMRYLATKHGAESWYPSALHHRAIVDQWLDWQLAHLLRPMHGLFFGVHLKAEPENDPQRIAAAASEANRLFGIFDQQLQKTGGYAAGRDPTIADCALGMMVHRWYALDIERADLPAIERYYKALSERPAFQTAILNAGP